MNKIPIFEIFLNDDEQLGLALVDYPAIEHNFLYFNDEQQILLFNDEKMIITGPALVPNQLIFRNNINGTQGYVYYSKETIFNFVQSFLKKKDEKINIGHTDNFVNLDIVESYFAKDGNEFNVPEGSWIVTAKVNDKDVWNKIKQNKLNGFSIEGMFTVELVGYEEFNKQNMKNELKEKLLNFVNQVLFSDEQVVTPDVPVEQVETVTVEPEVIPTPDPVVEPVLPEPDKKDEVIERLMSELASLRDELKSVNEKVEKYGNQPLQTSVVTEPVANVPTSKTKPKAAEFFN